MYGLPAGSPARREVVARAYQSASVYARGAALGAGAALWKFQNDENGARGWYYRHFGRQFARARGLGHGLGTENGSFLFETIEVGKTDGTMRISVERRSRTRSRGWSKWVPARVGCFAC